MLHTDTRLGFICDAIGLGVVATRPIPRGTIVWTTCALDRVFEREGMARFTPEIQAQIVKWSLVDAAGDYLVCWDDGRYVNHACEPSMLPLGRDVEIVVRDIQPGDHVTAEYGRQNVAPFACACGAKSCRGTVRAEDALRHGAEWDRLLAETLPLVREVAQPLLPYVQRPDELWAWVDGRVAPPSLRDSYYPGQAGSAAPPPAPSTELALTLPPRVTPRPVQPTASTLGALMCLFEELSRHCFARGLPLTITGGGEAVVGVAMPPDDLRRLRATFRPTATMRLSREEAGDARVSVVPGEDSRFQVRVEVVAERGEVRAGPMPLFSGRERVAADAGRRPFEDGRGPATAAVRDFGSVAEALRETGGTAPFRVLGFGDFGADLRRFDDLLSREEEPLLAWTWSRETEAEMVKRYVAPADAARALRDGSLDVTIVDAPVRAPGLALPDALRPWPLCGGIL